MNNKTIIITIILTLMPDSPVGPESPGNPMGPYGKNQWVRNHQPHCMTLTRKSHWFRETHKVAFGSILPWCSSGSWRPSCSGRARVTLLPHIAVRTLEHIWKDNWWKGEERQRRKDEVEQDRKGWWRQRDSQQCQALQLSQGLQLLHPHPDREVTFSKIKTHTHTGTWAHTSRVVANEKIVTFSPTDPGWPTPPGIPGRPCGRRKEESLNQNVIKQGHVWNIHLIFDNQVLGAVFSSFVVSSSAHRKLKLEQNYHNTRKTIKCQVCYVGSTWVT